MRDWMAGQNQDLGLSTDDYIKMLRCKAEDNLYYSKDGTIEIEHVYKRLYQAEQPIKTPHRHSIFTICERNDEEEDY